MCTFCTRRRLEETVNLIHILNAARRQAFFVCADLVSVLWITLTDVTVTTNWEHSEVGFRDLPTAFSLKKKKKCVTPRYGTTIETLCENAFSVKTL
jgi:hypothetical protein